MRMLREHIPKDAHRKTGSGHAELSRIERDVAVLEKTEQLEITKRLRVSGALELESLHVHPQCAASDQRDVSQPARLGVSAGVSTRIVVSDEALRAIQHVAYARRPL
jgi:hypothetical protein